MKKIKLGEKTWKLIFEDDKEWLAFRKNRIGASDASIILGTSKWKTTDGRIKTPYLLWQEKLGLDQIDSDNAATRYGKAMEEPARQVYQNMVGDLFEATCVIHDDYPHLMVSLDGLNITNDKMVEIKNCKLEDHEKAMNGEVPEKYVAQVQMQMMVSNLPENDYFSFHKGDGIIVTAKRDEKYIKDLNKKLLEFWDCVSNLKEPALTENDYIEQNDEWLAVATQLFEAKQRKKVATEEEKALSDLLKSLSSNRNARSGAYRYTCSTQVGRVDYKSIPELLNRDLSEYTGLPTERWTLSKAKPKN